MNSKWHILFGFVFAYTLLYFFDLPILIGTTIFLASFLIDVDHYFWYVYSFKDWNPLNAMNWYNKNIDKWLSMSINERKPFQRGVFVFHSLPLLILIGFIITLHWVFLALFLGFLIHLIADWAALVYYQEPLYNKLLPCLVVIKNRGKKPLTEL
jgi:hypothetical protein